MANLVQRITGDITNAEQVDANHTKIAIHLFLSALGELKRGKITLATVVSWFNLTAAQEAQLITLNTIYQASTEKTEFMRVFKDLMYMGESNIDPNYRDITFIQTRLETEVTDNGGVI